MIVISYYTPNNDYPKFAKNLKENLDRLGIHYEILRVESAGSRKKNINLRWKILKEAMDKFNSPLLYLDIDSEILKMKEFYKFYDLCCKKYDFVAGDKLNQPDLVFESGEEMRKFSIKHNMPIYWDVRWRGTQTFFNNTLAGKELIRECFLLYEKNIDCTSEQILTSVVRKVREKNIATLPSEFMVTKSFLWNENNIKELRDKKLDWDDPKAVVRYIKVNRNGWNADGTYYTTLPEDGNIYR